jgi:hypothetical protein
MLCFRDLPGGTGGLGREQITAAFTDRWRVDSIEPATLDSATDLAGIPAWLATLTST